MSSPSHLAAPRIHAQRCSLSRPTAPNPHPPLGPPPRRPQPSTSAAPEPSAAPLPRRSLGRVNMMKPSFVRHGSGGHAEFGPDVVKKFWRMSVEATVCGFFFAFWCAAPPPPPLPPLPLPLAPTPTLSLTLSLDPPSPPSLPSPLRPPPPLPLFCLVVRPMLPPTRPRPLSFSPLAVDLTLGLTAAPTRSPDLQP